MTGVTEKTIDKEQAGQEEILKMNAWISLTH
jgi:hypothetical protein